MAHPPNSPSPAKFRVAIIGGGIGGLTTAAALSHSKTDHDIDIHVYEAAPRLTQVGAGITIWPRAWDILRDLGISDALFMHLPEEQMAKLGQRGLAFSFRKSDQKEGEDLCDLEVTGRCLYNLSFNLHQYCGKNKHIVAYPVLKGTYLNAVVYFSEPEKEGTKLCGPEMVEVDTDEVASKFVGWEDEVTSIVQAHAMTPHLGSGAGQAMEDAFILAALISESKLNGKKEIDVENIAQVYDTVRRPFANFVLAGSRDQGMIYELVTPEFHDVGEGDVLTRERRRIFVAEKRSEGWGSSVRPGGGATSFHRADVQDVLIKHISERVRFHLSHRLRTYSESKGVVHLEFDGGQKASCDILIGADGLKSAVRKRLLDLEADPKVLPVRYPQWSGTYAYRSLINSDVIKAINPHHSALTKPMVYCGKYKHVVVYPVLKGTYLNLVPFYTEVGKEGSQLNGPEVVEVSTDEVASKFVGWEDEVLVLVKAHAMTTHFGNGAGQAIEDAYILANLIAESTKRNRFDVARIARVYDTIRLPFANFVLTGSRDQGMLYEFITPDFEDVREGDVVAKEKLDKLAGQIKMGWSWMDETSPLPDKDRALRTEVISRIALSGK
ncbi:hypothetical protein CVT24_001474 [Panaeolus cyanescens]|uniref:FAD-binding domain-containing protein n=1 Tax=Panaeolus cyanescens TaxID=181874 RepID=A0A409VT17_9AGAR|nr:hypothetical protein CVT24_001474 [Panaeolus cyanescens]